MTEPVKLSGTRFIAEVEPGSTLRVFGRLLVVAHPSHPVRVFDEDGELDISDPRAGDAISQMPLPHTPAADGFKRLDVIVDEVADGSE